MTTESLTLALTAVQFAILFYVIIDILSIIIGRNNIKK